MIENKEMDIEAEEKEMDIEAEEKEMDIEAEEDVPRRAILFELENIAVKGRQIVYDVLKNVLADKRIELTPTMFAKYCVNSSVKYFLPALLESKKKTRLSESKLSSEITQGIRLSFAGGAAKLDAGLAKVLKDACKKNVLVGALSSLDEKTAQQLADKQGLVSMGITLLSYSYEDKIYPSADAWLKLAKNMYVLPSLCVAMATSSMACKAALSAGMRCIVVPDKFTSFQDFGGADYVMDDLGETAIQSISSLLDLC